MATTTLSMRSVMPTNVGNSDDREQQKVCADRSPVKPDRPDGATWGDFRFAQRLSEVTPRYDLKEDKDKADDDMFSLFAWSNSSNGTSSLKSQRSKFEEDQRLNRQSISNKTEEVVALVAKTEEVISNDAEEEERRRLYPDEHRQLRRASMGGPSSVRDLGLEEQHEQQPRRRRAQRRSSMPLMPTYHQEPEPRTSRRVRRTSMSNKSISGSAAEPAEQEPESRSGGRMKRRSSMPKISYSFSSGYDTATTAESSVPPTRREPERQRSERRRYSRSHSPGAILDDETVVASNETQQRPRRACRRHSSSGGSSNQLHNNSSSKSLCGDRRGPERQRSSRSRSPPDQQDYGYERAEPDSARLERQRSGRSRRSDRSRSPEGQDYEHEDAVPDSARLERQRSGRRSGRQSSSRNNMADTSDYGYETAVPDSAARHRSRKARRRSSMDNYSLAQATTDDEEDGHDALRASRKAERRKRRNSRDGDFYNDTSEGRQRSRRRPSNEDDQPVATFDQDAPVRRRSGRASRRASM